MRNSGETAPAILPGALEIPLAVLSERIASLDAAQPVVTYCASGYRSLIAASFLTQQGCVDVSDLLGGFSAWVATGLPTEPGGRAEPPDVGNRHGGALRP